MHHKIVIIDDDEHAQEALEIHLTSAGFSVVTLTDAATALNRVRAELPALIILDLMIANMAGLEICKTLKSEAATIHIPIIMLTAKSDEVDVIVGLELGADDYVIKPFSPRELLLRINRSLRLGSDPAENDEAIVIGDLALDPVRHEVTVENVPVVLTSIEFKLLSLLMSRRGRAQSRERLLSDLWRYESAVDSRTIDTHVKRLRRKLGVASNYIETLRGVGYRLVETGPGQEEKVQNGAANSHSTVI